MKPLTLCLFCILVLVPNMARAQTTLNFAAAAVGTQAPGWQGTGVVVVSPASTKSLDVAGRKDNDEAVTPPLPARAGKTYILGYRLQLKVDAGNFVVQFRCLDAQQRQIRPEWEYPKIYTHSASLARPTSVFQEVSLAGVEPETAYVQIVFKWWGTPSGDARLQSVSWQPRGNRPTMVNARILDIRAACNRGFASGASAKGGSSGPDRNDLRFLQPGTYNLDGLPLRLIDPAHNHGRSLIVVGGPAGLARSVTFPMGQRVGEFYALQNAALTRGAAGQPAARWTFHYADGSSASTLLVTGRDLADWWRPEDTENSVVALTTVAARHTPVGLNLEEISNPHPKKTVASLEIASAGASAYDLAAITLVDSGSLIPWLRLQPQVQFHKAAGAWFPCPLPWGAPETPSPTNVSWLLDRPAGKHGFVGVKNGQFRFGDGTRARFLATTAGWSFWAVPHRTADEMAAYLARNGVNLLRIFPQGNIDGTDPRTFTLDPVKQEEMDYLLAQLRRRGIYVYFYTSIVQLIRSPLLPALTHGSQTQNRALGIFDPDWIRAEQRYWRLLLTHKNPYTGKSLAEDPMLALLVLTNENEMYDTVFDGRDPAPPYFRDELTRLWNRWLLDHYGTREALAAQWKAMGAEPLGGAEDPARGTVALPSLGERGRGFSFRQFCGDTQARYTGTMVAYLRTLGVKCPIQDTNSIYTPEGLFLMGKQDFSGYHLYGPYMDGSPFTVANYSVLKRSDPLLGNLSSFPGADALGRLAGKPFVLGEWNVGYPNDFRGGGIVQGFAYGLLQDWDCLNYFCFFEDISKLKPTDPAISDSLASAFDPARVGLFPAIALMFYRQDISPAKKTIYRRFTQADLLQREKERGYPAAVGYVARGSSWIPFVHRYAIAPGQAPVPKGGTTIGGPDEQAELSGLRKNAERAGLINETSRVVRSDNGQLTSDFTHGIVTIDTARTQGASGGLDEVPKLALSGLRISGASTFATILFSSLDGLPLDHSNRILVTVMGDAANSDEVSGIDRTELANAPAHGRFHPSRYTMRSNQAGRRPTVAEPVAATLNLRRSPGAVRLQCHSLNPAGAVTGVVPTRLNGGWLRLSVNGQYRSVYYLLAR
ncbi:MAG TPA: hypothetical protein VFJ58_20985 [Armatimonadota bacterium]|nr:hypothetical protein [Armatimonadota bacterium]